MKTLLSLFLVLGSLAALSESCASTHTGAKLEAMTTEQFDSLSLRVQLVTRVALGRLYSDGKVDKQRILTIADTVDAAIASPDLIVLGTGLISGKLRAQGWTEDEVLLAVLLVEDFVRSQGGIGEPGLPLGPHAKALLTTISVALRQSVGGTTPAEAKQADKVLKEAKVTL